MRAIAKTGEGIFMRLAIVDDDAQQRSLLEEYVKKYFEEQGKVCDVVCFSSGVDFASDYAAPFDIILLDIDMPHMNGIEAAKKIRQVDEHAVIIFITRMAQYAIQGYEVDALDFMVKPVSYFNLSVKLARAVRKVPRRSSIAVSADGKTVFLGEDDIFYIDGHNQYVIYHTVSGNYKVHSTLKEAEKQLSAAFSRCNNSFIVNLRYLSHLENADAVVGSERLPVSRGRRKAFLEDVNRYLGGI